MMVKPTMLNKCLAAGALAVAVLATPAIAQSSADDARFQAAQERFDREYRVFQQEADRYQQARGARGGYVQPAPVNPAYDNGTYNSGGYRRAPDPYTGAGAGYEDDSPVYDPSRDYRAGGQYRERVLTTDDRVYAGYDGRYYCRRSDGTTGLILGGAAGGVLGNVIDGGRSRTVGTLLGLAGGALAGRAIQQNQQVRCR